MRRLSSLLEKIFTRFSRAFRATVVVRKAFYIIRTAQHTPEKSSSALPSPALTRHLTRRTRPPACSDTRITEKSACDHHGLPRDTVRYSLTECDESILSDAMVRMILMLQGRASKPGMGRAKTETKAWFALLDITRGFDGSGPSPCADVGTTLTGAAHACLASRCWISWTNAFGACASTHKCMQFHYS